MPTRKKVLSKKAAASSECGLVKKSGCACPVCGCRCGGAALVESSLVMVFGGLVVALSFFLMRSML